MQNFAYFLVLYSLLCSGVRVDDEYTTSLQSVGNREMVEIGRIKTICLLHTYYITHCITFIIILIISDKGEEFVVRFQQLDRVFTVLNVQDNTIYSPLTQQEFTIQHWRLHRMLSKIAKLAILPRAIMVLLKTELPAFIVLHVLIETTLPLHMRNTAIDGR